MDKVVRKVCREHAVDAVGGQPSHSASLDQPSYRSTPIHACVSTSSVQWALHFEKLCLSPQMCC